MISPLEMTLFLLLASVAGVVVFRFLNLPPMLGYLTVGIVVGPHAFGIVPDSQGAQNLAEFGVVFLMFSIGLEFSLAKLRSMRRLVFGLGLLQVIGTVAVAVGLGFVLERWVHITWQGSVALGGALAMSSTAIVSKMLAERLEIETEHGRNIFGVLLFQDLAVVPLLIIISALGGDSRTLMTALGLAAVKIVVALSLLLIVGQKFMTRWFNVVARRRSQELFILNLLLVTLGAAFITDKFGLSLALGAFIAGMLIAETPYRHQVEEDIKPFRDVLLGLFFVTTGMLLNPMVIWKHPFIVLAFLLGPIAAEADHDHRVVALVRCDAGRGDAYRHRPRPGRRIRLRAAEPDSRQASGRRDAPAGDSRRDAAVDAGRAVPDPERGPHRAAAVFD